MHAGTHKPFANLREFYGYYLGEHSNRIIAPSAAEPSVRFPHVSGHVDGPHRVLSARGVAA
jgi:hypothetical protein